MRLGRCPGTFSRSMAELPSWMSGSGQRKARNRRSARQERDRAQEIGGRVSAGSGSSWRSPQDVRNGEYLEQLKFTDKKQYTIKEDEWIGLRADALREGKEPRLVIDTPFGRLVITEE